MPALESTRRNERDPGKAPDAFRTISEVAEDLDVPQHVLRFWETRFGQIKPLKRGGGRRYYRPDDVDLLRGIRHLLYGEGYTIRGVQRLLKERGVKFVQGVWLPGGAAALKGSDHAPADNAAEDIGDEAAEAEAAESGATDEAAVEASTPEPAPQPRLSRIRSLATPLPLDKTRADPLLAHPLSPALGSGAAAAPVASPSSATEERATPGLSTETRAALQAVLADLTECRRLVDAALKGD